jgi:hypothetical protein
VSSAPNSAAQSNATRDPTAMIITGKANDQ